MLVSVHKHILEEMCYRFDSILNIITSALRYSLQCTNTNTRDELGGLTQYPRGSRSAHSTERCSLRGKHTHTLLILHLKQTCVVAAAHTHTNNTAGCRLILIQYIATISRLTVCKQAVCVFVFHSCSSCVTERLCGPLTIKKPSVSHTEVPSLP